MAGTSNRNRGNADGKHATAQLVLKVAIAAIKQVPLHRQLQANAKVLLSASELTALTKRMSARDSDSTLEAFNSLAHKIIPNDDVLPLGSYERNMLAVSSRTHARSGVTLRLSIVTCTTFVVVMSGIRQHEQHIDVRRKRQDL